MARFENIDGGVPVDGAQPAGMISGRMQDALDRNQQLRDDITAQGQANIAAANEATEQARKRLERFDATGTADPLLAAQLRETQDVQASLDKIKNALKLAYTKDSRFSRAAKLANETAFSGDAYKDFASRINIAGEPSKGQATFTARDGSYSYLVTDTSITHLDTDKVLSGQEVNDWHLIAAQNKNWMRSGVTLTGSVEDRAFMKVMFEEVLPHTTGVTGPKVLNKDKEFSPEIMAQARVKAQQYKDQLAAEAQAQPDIAEPEAAEIDTALLKENLKAEILANPDAKYNIVFRGDLEDTGSPEALASDRDPANQETLRIHFTPSDTLDDAVMHDALTEVISELENEMAAPDDTVEATSKYIPGSEQHASASFMQPLTGDYGDVTVNGEPTSVPTEKASQDGAEAQKPESINEEPVAGTPINANGEIDFNALRRLDGIIPVTTLENPSDLTKTIEDASRLATAKEAVSAKLEGQQAHKFGAPDVAPAPADNLTNKLRAAAALKTGALPATLYPALKEHIQETGVATNTAINSFLKDAIKGEGLTAKLIDGITKDAVAKLTKDEVIAPIGNSNRREVLPTNDFAEAAAAPKTEDTLKLTPDMSAIPAEASINMPPEQLSLTAIPRVSRTTPADGSTAVEAALAAKSHADFSGAAEGKPQAAGLIVGEQKSRIQRAIRAITRN